MQTPIIRVHAALITVSLIYGYFYVAVKLLLREMTEAEFILLRFVLTGLIVFFIEKIFFKTKFENNRDFLKLAGLGLLGVFLVQILVVVGLHRTTAFHSALIMSTIPILTLMFGILLGRETYHIQKVLGILTAFAGVVILLFFTKNPGTALPETYLIGDFIVLLNAIAFSWFLIGSQQMLQKYNSFSVMAYCYIISGAVFGAVFFGGNALGVVNASLGFLKELSPWGWTLMAYVVLFASITSYTLNNYALSRINPSIVAVYIFLQPITSAVLGFYLLHEPFNANMAMAALITFIGVVLATAANHKGILLRKKPEPPQAAEPADEEPEVSKIG